MPDNRPNVIDSLTIELVGKAKSAIDALAEVNGQLLLLQSSLSKVKNTKITSDFINKSAADRIAELKTALSGFKTSEADAFRATIETLSGIDTTGLKDLGAAAKGLNPLKKISEINSAPIKEFAQTLNEMNMSGIQKLGEAAKGLESFRAMARLSREGSGKHLGEVFRSLEMVNPETIKKLGDAATGLKGFASIATLSRNSEGFQIIIDGLMRLSGVNFTNLTYLTEAAKSLADLYREYNKLYKAATKLSEAQNTVNIKFRDMTKETKKAGHAASRTNGIIGRFFSTIKRIAFYRVIRSALRSITAGFSEGIENLYRWSQAVGTSFAPSMDRLATATLYLKNGFASMFSPLIEYAVPIIDAVIDKLVDFFNLIQEGIARITGQATWNKALKYPASYKDALDDVTASAKEFKNQLMGFDELNVISTPSNSSRGRGSDALDYSSMFQLMETDAAEGGKSIGAKIADAIGEVFKDPDKFGEYGETAADAIGTAFDNTIDFFKEGHENGMFTRIGTSLSNFLSKFATKLAEKIRDNDWVETIDSLTTAICDIIDGVNLGDILRSLAKLIVSITFSIPSMVIASLGSALKLTSSYIKLWARAFGEDSFIGSLLMGSASIIDSGAEKVNALAKKWEKLGDMATTAVFNAIDGKGLTLDTETQNALAGGAAKGGAKGIEIPITPTIQEEKPKADTWWSNFKNNVWGKKEAPVTPIVTINAYLVREGWQNFLRSWGTRIAYVTTAVQSFWSDVNQGYQNFKTLWGIKRAEVTTLVRSTWSDIRDGYNQLKALWGNKHLDTWTKVQTTWKAIQDGWKGVKDLWGEWRNLAVGIAVTIGNVLATAWQSIVNWWTGNTRTLTVNVAANTSGAKKKARGGYIDGYATGGYPAGGGTLFWAGEGGIPEMLGTVNGRNAVAGGMEITGIREAIVAQGQAERQMLGQLIAAVNSKDLTLVANSSTGRWVSKSLRAYQGVTG